MRVFARERCVVCVCVREREERESDYTPKVPNRKNLYSSPSKVG